MIIGEIKRYLRDNNTLRVSRSVRDLAYKSLQIRETLSRKLGREVTVSEIVNVLTESGENRSEEEVEYALEAISPPVSIFDPVYGEGNDAVFVMDQLRDDNDGEEIWLESICLKEAMKKLSQREKTILGMRFYNGKTQMEVADEIGISQAQVSRLEKGAIERIKKQM
jgi:RNA polymerase sporulation-specific sigma factor